MPRFESLPASAVLVGRARTAALQLEPYRIALAEMDAGRVDLERGEEPEKARRMIKLAANANGKRVYTGVIEGGRAVIFKTYPNIRTVREVE